MKQETTWHHTMDKHVKQTKRQKEKKTIKTNRYRIGKASQMMQHQGLESPQWIAGCTVDHLHPATSPESSSSTTKTNQQKPRIKMYSNWPMAFFWTRNWSHILLFFLLLLGRCFTNKPNALLHQIGPWWVSEWVLLPARHITGHFGDESFQTRTVMKFDRVFFK